MKARTNVVMRPYFSRRKYHCQVHVPPLLSFFVNNVANSPKTNAQKLKKYCEKMCPIISRLDFCSPLFDFDLFWREQALRELSCHKDSLGEQRLHNFNLFTSSSSIFYLQPDSRESIWVPLCNDPSLGGTYVALHFFYSTNCVGGFKLPIQD
jgi:hypothetical protein